MGIVDDPALDEISGLVASHQSPGVFWVHEDSGADGVITALDIDGVTLGTITLDGVNPDDDEDIALGPCGDGAGWCLLLGDIGDNAAARSEVVIRRVPEPYVSLASALFDLDLEPEELTYTYPEGAQDAEALVVRPDGSPVVITKRTDGDAWVYTLPADGWDAPALATRVAVLPMGTAAGLLDAVTAADLTSDGERLLIRTYTYLRHYDLSSTGVQGVADAPTREILTGAELQGEAVGWHEDDRSIFHVSEEPNPRIYELACSSVP